MVTFIKKNFQSKSSTLTMGLLTQIFAVNRNHDSFHNLHVTLTYYAQHLRWAGNILKVSIPDQKKKNNSYN